MVYMGNEASGAIPKGFQSLFILISGVNSLLIFLLWYKTGGNLQHLWGAYWSINSVRFTKMSPIESRDFYFTSHFFLFSIINTLHWGEVYLNCIQNVLRSATKRERHNVNPLNLVKWQSDWYAVSLWYAVTNCNPDILFHIHLPDL